jgi:hypothetical protein
VDHVQVAVGDGCLGDQRGARQLLEPLARARAAKILSASGSILLVLQKRVPPFEISMVRNSPAQS